METQYLCEDDNRLMDTSEDVSVCKKSKKRLLDTSDDLSESSEKSPAKRLKTEQLQSGVVAYVSSPNDPKGRVYVFSSLGTTGKRKLKLYKKQYRAYLRKERGKRRVFKILKHGKVKITIVERFDDLPENTRKAKEALDEAKRAWLEEFQDNTMSNHSRQSIGIETKGGSSQRRFACSLSGCGKRFKRRAHLNSHMLSHTGAKPFKCNVVGCGKAYSRRDKLKSHELTHQGEKPFKCAGFGCNKSFNRQDVLALHIRTHTKQHWNVCDVCGVSICDKSNFKVHQRIHTGAKPFICPLTGCGKAFSHSHSLGNHMRVHIGAKPFKCNNEHCDYASSQSSNVKQHVKAMHTPEGSARQKKSENMLANDFKKMAIEFKREQHIDLSKIGGTYRRVDFRIPFSTHLALTENNENQHNGVGYSVACEMRRITDIVSALRIAGETRPLLFVMFNPGPLSSDGKKVKLQRKKRLPPLKRAIETPPAGDLGVVWVCYDEIEGEPEIYSDPAFDATIRACSTAVTVADCEDE